jgi:hypothetical protein
VIAALRTAFPAGGGLPSVVGSRAAISEEDYGWDKTMVGLSAGPDGDIGFDRA